MAGKKARTRARKADQATTLSNTPEIEARGPFSSTASSHQFKPSVLSKTKPKPGQAGDTFDVFMLKDAPGKGLGAFATKTIKCSATVYSEKPLVIIEKPPNDITEQDICEAYVKLTPHEQRVFDGMRNCHVGKGCQCKTGRFFSSIFNLEDAWRRTGCFPICSRFNHSCRPNIACALVTGGDRVTFKAIVDIAEGEELCFAYCVDFQYMTLSERTAFLHTESRNFDCLCEVCTLPPDARLVSDMRRCIMRHLFFWIEGKDLYEAPPAIISPDPKLQSPTRPFSYEYLLVALAEAEGVRAGGMIAKSYMSIIAQICAVALATRQTYVPRRLLKQMRKWLEVGHELGRIHIGPKHRILTHFACPKEFLASIENDGRIRWDLFFPAKGSQMC